MLIGVLLVISYFGSYVFLLENTQRYQTLSNRYWWNSAMLQPWLAVYARLRSCCGGISKPRADIVFVYNYCRQKYNIQIILYNKYVG